MIRDTERVTGCLRHGPNRATLDVHISLLARAVDGLIAVIYDVADIVSLDEFFVHEGARLHEGLLRSLNVGKLRAGHVHLHELFVLVLGFTR